MHTALFAEHETVMLGCGAKVSLEYMYMYIQVCKPLPGYIAQRFRVAFREL